MPRRTASPSLLPLLRSETQAGILERLLLHARRGYTVNELAESLGVTPMAVRRELVRLERASIVSSEKIGRTGLYRANVGSPLFEPLQHLVERSVGVEALLRDALSSHQGIDHAVIFGSWAKGHVDEQSDVDVLVVGDIDYPAVAADVLALQERTGREINLVAMKLDELRSLRRDQSGFIRDILSSPMRILIGEPLPKT